MRFLATALRLSLVLPLLAMAAARGAEIVKIGVVSWCPYMCDGESRPGILIEITAAALAAQGLTAQFISLPWQRQLALMRSGGIDAVVGTAKSDAPDFVFPNHPVGRYVPCFFVRSGSSWHYDGIDSLRTIRLSVLDAQSFNDKLVDDYVNGEGKANGKVDFLHSEEFEMQHFKKLLSGRVDAVAEDREVVRDHLESTHQTDLVREAGCLAPSDLWVAFSPAGATPRILAKSFDQGIAMIEKSGLFAAIYAKYGMDGTGF